MPQGTGAFVKHWKPPSHGAGRANGIAPMLVHDYMTPDPFVVSSEEPLSGIAEALRGHGIHQVPVVDAGNRLVGIVTDRDLRGAVGLKNPKEVCLTAGDIMTAKVVTVTPGTRLEEALDILTSAGFGALPVVVGQHVVGILSSRDLLRRFKELLEERSRSAAIGTIGPRPAPGRV